MRPRMVIALWFSSIILLSNCYEKITDPNAEHGNFELCYKKLIDMNWEIVVNLDRDNPINISNNPKEDSDPAWSPDGHFIAFTYFNSIGGTDVYSYDVESNSLNNLTPGLDYSARSPLWSPDGLKIIFNYHILGDPYYTYIMNNDGSDKRKLLDFQADIHFCSDSYHFIYSQVSTSTETGNHIYKTDINGITNELILDLDTLGQEYTRLYDFDPIKEEMLLLIAEQPRITSILATYNLNTEVIDTLSVAEAGWIYLSATYSYDYSKIAFIAIDMEKSLGKIVILENKEEKEVAYITESGQWIDYHPMQFSPSGRYLAYSLNINQPGTMVWWKSYLYALDIESKEKTRIDEGKSPQWNPIFPN